MKEGEGGTGGTESPVLSNPELTAKVSQFHFSKTCCQQQLWELRAGAERTPRTSQNCFRAKTFTLTCYLGEPTQGRLCLCLTQAHSKLPSLDERVWGCSFAILPGSLLHDANSHIPETCGPQVSWIKLPSWSIFPSVDGAEMMMILACLCCLQVA